MRSDDGAVIGMPLRKQRLVDRLFDDAVRAVLVALAAFVADDVLLVRQALLIDDFEEVPHAIGFEPQRRLELIRRNGLEVIGAIETGGAVDAGRADASEDAEVRVVFDVLRALEHHVLEQVRKAGPAWRLVRGTDVVPHADADERHAMIFREDHFEPVRQRVLFDIELGNIVGRLLTRHGHRNDDRSDQRQDAGATYSHGLFSRLAHRYQDATDR